MILFINGHLSQIRRCSISVICWRRCGDRRLRWRWLARRFPNAAVRRLSRLYRNLGNFQFENATDHHRLASDQSWGTGTTFADIDNDADLDLFVCGYDCPNRLFVNLGNGTFAERGVAAGIAFLTGESVMMAFADYDLDGDLDGLLV